MTCRTTRRTPCNFLLIAAVVSRVVIEAVIAVVIGLGLGFTTPARASETECIPIVLLYDENEELSERRSDTNRDCSHDEFVFYEQGKPVRSTPS